jgi:hypothetical protein
LFYFIQSPSKTLQCIAELIASDLLATPPLIGGALLRCLLQRRDEAAGDTDKQAVLSFFITKSMVPFMEILSQWVYLGKVDDPHNEFFVEERTSAAIQKEGITKDFLNAYWAEKFALRKEMLPRFLNIYLLILPT